MAVRAFWIERSPISHAAERQRCSGGCPGLSHEAFTPSCHLPYPLNQRSPRPEATNSERHPHLTRTLPRIPSAFAAFRLTKQRLQAFDLPFALGDQLAEED